MAVRVEKKAPAASRKERRAAAAETQRRRRSSPAEWNTALPDWKERILSGRSLISEDLPINDDVADKALSIFKMLRVPDMHGQPTYGSVCREWVFDLVRVIFGCYDPELHRRALKEFFVLVPKGNGKTAISAAIVVTWLILNEMPWAEGILIAPRMAIAERAFQMAEGIILADPELEKLFLIQGGIKKISHRETFASVQVFAADVDIITGAKASLILIDELHEFAQRKKARDILLELKGSLGKRADGFLLTITTQSKEPPAGVFKSELEMARMVRDGEMRLPILPVLYELPPELQKGDAWQRREFWGLVNPNLDASIQSDYIEAELFKARIEGKAAMALFASQHFNVQIGTSMRANAWAGAEDWDTCSDPGLATLEGLLKRSEVAVIGGDIGGKDDLFALCVLGRDKVTKDWLAWVRCWAIRKVMETRVGISERLTDFEEAGDLVLTETAAEHVTQAADVCDMVRAAGLFPEHSGIGLDPWGVAALHSELITRGYDPQLIGSVGQGYKLTGAIGGVERRLYDGTLRHSGQGIMQWCVGNAKAERAGNGTKVDKQTAGSDKIDPLIALFNAAVLMDRNPIAHKKTSYSMLVL